MMLPIQLNAVFVANIHTLYGKTGKAWLNHLPEMLKQLCDKHDLRFIKPLPTLSYHFIGQVEIKADNKLAILKIAPNNKNIEQEAKWLRCFTQVVPEVYWFDDEYYALLMENLAPGQPLKSLVATNDDAATRIICKTILELQSHQQSQAQFKHLSELTPGFSALKGRVDAKLLSQAISWFQQLTIDRTHDVLLHGDLHHDNILSGGLSWKAIDPHGYIGDPAFEVGAMIYNPVDAFPSSHTVSQTVERRLKILAEALPFDQKRIQAWAFCMTILSMAWTVEDHDYLSEPKLQIANAILRS